MGGLPLAPPFPLPLHVIGAAHLELLEQRRLDLREAWEAGIEEAGP